MILTVCACLMPLITNLLTFGTAIAANIRGVGLVGPVSGKAASGFGSWSS